MFYSQFILAKKGPLGTIWIAAHLERKLRKNQVADTDIGHSVDSILFPDMPIALRLSSHLLLGVVRIYSRKVNYLFDDCSEALLKVKQAFRSTAVDLPPEESTAPYHSITLPETFDLDDFELPDNDLFQGNFVDHHVSTREQITLQDTMDGTVYSTSQFGLDERFGDGDTSQIGLDLEEELFSEKAVAPVQDADSGADPQASTLPMELTTDDKDNRAIIDTSESMLDNDRNKQIGGLTSYTEPMDYAQTPCTPGLVEKPIGEAFACDSHSGPEDHTSKEYLDIESVENVSRKLDLHQLKIDAVSMSQNDTSHDIINCKSLDENGHFLHSVEENPENLEQLANTIPLDGNGSIKYLPDGANNNEQTICSSEPGAEQIESQVCLDNSCQQVSSYSLKDGHGSGQLEGPSNAEVLANAEASCVPEIVSVAEDICALGSSDKPELATGSQTCHDQYNLNSSNNIDQGENTSVSMQLLRPCSSLPNEDVSSSNGIATLEDGQGADIQAIDPEKPALQLQETHLMEPTLSQVRLDNISSGEVDNDIYHDNQSGNLNTSGPTELPAPEKLLSAPVVHADKPNDLLAESTPNKEGQAGGDIDHATNTQISGKKRSLTESTLTVQSLDSEEWFSRSKRSAESIPEDDDVLSSILVGRFSGLKMKRTPSAPEVPTSKRLKSSQRPSTIKRKILLDDAMVLHGDTIRQQLVSTEDIRRIRKKAPCTRPEILLIQRQFSGDGILNEIIFTGMSVDLNYLHSESYDLSRIRVLEDAGTVAPSELQNIAESSVRHIAPEGTKNEGRTTVPSIGNSSEAQTAELSIQNDSFNNKDQVLDFDDINATREVVTEPEPENLHSQMLGNAVDMDIERVSVAVDAEDRPALDGLEFSSTPDPLSGEHKTEDNVGLGQTGAECFSPGTKLNLQIDDHASVVHTVGEKGFDAIEGAVDNISIQVEGGSAYGTPKGFELDENRDGSTIDLRADDQRDANPLEMTNNSNTIAPQEAGNCDKLVSEGGDQIVDELEDKELDKSNKDVFPMEFPCEDKIPSPRSIHEQEPDTLFHVVEYPLNVDSSVKDGECWASDEADIRNGMDAESTVINQPMGENHYDLENIRDKNDTEFLNEDDAEVTDEGDCGLHTSEQLENSGWSARTRAVAKYLQDSFDKEAIHGSKVLSVDNLLSGKSRKEASRMFFETLVLKTRDYIHVEQANPLDNIILKPRLKLMKSEF